MSQTSDWPLPTGSTRYLVPHFLREQLQQHPLSTDLYPISFGHYKDAAGHRMQRDDPDDFLLIYCIKGTARLTVNNNEYSVQAGDLLLLPPGTAHAYQTPDQTPWSIYWLHLKGSACGPAAKQAGFCHGQYRNHFGVHPKLVQDLDRLMDCRTGGYSFQTALYAASLIRQILCYIALLKPTANATRSSQLNLDTVHSLMQENLHTRLDLDTLARAVNLSKFHFVNKYKELTGLTPIQHFLHLKIDRACYLLDITQQSVSEISYSLGYEDSYYFSRLFKKVMGIAPTQYRRKQRH